MRRNFLCALLFALALAVQAVAPAAARMAMGAASASAVCLAAGGGASADDAAPGRSHPAPEACDQCASCCGGVSPLVEPRCAIVSAAAPTNVSTWAARDDRAAPSRRDRLVRARAPPAFS